MSNNIRRTGRTTKLIADLLTYVHEHYNDKKVICISAQTHKMAWKLVGIINKVVTPSSEHNSCVVYGGVFVVVCSVDIVDRVRTELKIDKFFIDEI